MNNDNWCLTDLGLIHNTNEILYSDIQSIEFVNNNEYAIIQCEDGRQFFLYYDGSDDDAICDIKIAIARVNNHKEHCIKEREHELERKARQKELDKESRKGTFLIIAFFAMILLIIAISIIPVLFSSGSSSGSSRFECSVCHRDYDGKNKDMRSITNTGMCVQCKENYDWATGN